MSPETTLGTPQMGAVTSQFLLLAAITSLIVQSAGHEPARDFHVRTYILQYWDLSAGRGELPRYFMSVHIHPAMGEGEGEITFY